MVFLQIKHNNWKLFYSFAVAPSKQTHTEFLPNVHQSHSHREMVAYMANASTTNVPTRNLGHTTWKLSDLLISGGRLITKGVLHNFSILALSAPTRT